MDPHPDFIGVTLPRVVQLSGCKMTPLSPAHVQEDYDIVMETAHLLSDEPGAWPDGLTLEDNAIDLAWHEREFTTNRSFSWILRDDADTYLGCFYIYPDLGQRSTAKVVLWIRDMENRHERAILLHDQLANWIEANMPDGVKTHWHCNPII